MEALSSQSSEPKGASSFQLTRKTPEFRVDDVQREMAKARGRKSILLSLEKRRTERLDRHRRIARNYSHPVGLEGVSEEEEALKPMREAFFAKQVMYEMSHRHQRQAKKLVQTKKLYNPEKAGGTYRKYEKPVVKRVESANSLVHLPPEKVDFATPPPDNPVVIRVESADTPWTLPPVTTSSKPRARGWEPLTLTALTDYASQRQVSGSGPILAQKQTMWKVP